MPTVMIFTPCQHGLSHNEAESVEPEEAGTQVLFEAVLARANRTLRSSVSYRRSPNRG